MSGVEKGCDRACNPRIAGWRLQAEASRAATGHVASRQPPWASAHLDPVCCVKIKIWNVSLCRYLPILSFID